MARTRNIKPGFFQNEVLAELPPLARLLFSALWCWADRQGRLEDRPTRIKAQMLPYDNCDVDQLLDMLARAKEPFIVRYEVDGRKYIQITNFSVHQNPHCNEQESVIPPLPLEVEHNTCTVHAPCNNSTSTGNAQQLPGLISTSLSLPPSTNTPIKNMCEASKTTKADFEEFWKEVSPKKKKAKKLAKEAYIKAVKEISKDHDDPHAFLRDRIRAYFASELGKTRFANSPAPWLNQGHYDDDPESWKIAEAAPSKPAEHDNLEDVTIYAKQDKPAPAKPRPTPAPRPVSKPSPVVVIEENQGDAFGE